MIRLGGNVITTENAREFSSAIKGETLEDSIKVISSYADVIALRHYEQGAAARAAVVSSVPVLNAGDGAGQHPTQAILDLYTIQREVGRVAGIRVAMLGDLKHGRTVRSLCYLLAKYPGVHIDFVSPESLKIGDDITTYLTACGVSFAEHTSFEAIIDNVDVVYQTRIQKERFVTEADYERYKGVYVLTVQNTTRMKPGAVIMHPLPRVDEIDPALDELPRAAYFRQVKYGLLIRMALLLEVCG
jgi:aspartate carbamoyltransferase catalytic subunit